MNRLYSADSCAVCAMKAAARSGVSMANFPAASLRNGRYSARWASGSLRRICFKQSSAIIDGESLATALRADAARIAGQPGKDDCYDLKGPARQRQCAPQERSSMRHAIPAALIAAFFLLSASPLAAQPAEKAPAAPAASSAPASPGAPSPPVPVPQPSDKAMRYYRSGNVLWAIGTLWGFAVPCLLLFTGFSARLRDAAARIGRRRFLTIAVYGILFTLVTFVLDLPLAFYEGFVREHA